MSSGDVIKRTETHSSESRRKSNPTASAKEIQEEEIKKIEMKPGPETESKQEIKELIVSDKDSQVGDELSSQDGFETASPDVIRKGN